MAPELAADRLLAIIQTQNEIAATALDLDAVMSLVLHRAQVLTGAEAAVIELADGDEMVYHVGRGTAARYVGLRLDMGTSLSGSCVRQRRTLHCADATTDGRVDLDACRRVGAMSMVCVPLIHAGRAAGVLKVYDPRPGAFSDEDVATLDLLSGVIAAHMAHAADFQQHHYASRHDALTGLPNRRVFEERLAGELARTRRHGGQLSVCLVDLDRFKQINDTYGHGAGDEVLRAVAGHLSRIRNEDDAYRLGGDEFALVLVGADREGADTVIRRIAIRIERDLVARADATLYVMKRALAA